MNATISPARVRAAGLAKYLRLVLHQTMHVAIVGFVPFGLSTVVTASTSGTVSYSELCSILAWSMMLTGILFALVIGVRTFFVQESWQMFVSRFATSIGLIPAWAGKGRTSRRRGRGVDPGRAAMGHVWHVGST